LISICTQSTNSKKETSDASDDLREPDWYDPFELAFDVLVEIVGSRITEDETL